MENFYRACITVAPDSLNLITIKIFIRAMLMTMFSFIFSRTLSQEINQNVSKLFCCCECKMAQRTGSYEPLSNAIALEPVNHSILHGVSSSEQVRTQAIRKKQESVNQPFSLYIQLKHN